MTTRSESHQDDPLYGGRQAATYLNISLRTLQCIAAAGGIDFVRVSARRVAYRLSTLNRYIESRTQRAAR